MSTPTTQPYREGESPSLPPRWPWPPDDPRRFRRSLTASDFPQIAPRTCRWCWAPVPKGQRTFCGPACVHELTLRTSTAYLASKVFERDQGVCALCGTDTARGRRLIYRWRGQAARKFHYMGASHRFAERIDRAIERILRERLALPAYGDGTAPWQADHIVPVSEGGGGCGLENMRTLCLPCHGRETGKLRRRLNANRKGQLPLLCRPGQETVAHARAFSVETA